MDGEGGNPFWIIAIIVIAFINWLSETLKNRQAAKRAEREREEYIREKANRPAGSPAVVDEDDAPLFAEDAQEEQSGAGASLAEFFESLTGQSIRQPEPEAVRQPPAIPREETKEPVVPKLSKEEQDALKRFESQDAMRQQPGRRRSSTSGIRKLLATPGAARQAFLLKEILDEPKGLQS